MDNLQVLAQGSVVSKRLLLPSSNLTRPPKEVSLDFFSLNINLQ